MKERKGLIEVNMKSIPVRLLKPGVTFTKPVYIDERNILVQAGVPIQQKDLDDLNEWKVESVLTEGVPGFTAENEYSPVPETTQQKTVSPFSLSEIQENKGAYRIYLSLVERLQAVFNKIQAAGKVKMDNGIINEISVSLLQAVRNQRDRFVGFILGSEVKGNEIAKSSVNTAILASLAAQELRLPQHKILYLITGALLHDSGMLRLPKEILNKRGRLSEEENRLMKSHPLLAYQIAVKELSYPDEVGKIVLQHHERWDGGGYPGKLSGEIIDTGAQIVSVADAFEAMVSFKPYRSPMLGHQAMKNLLADNSRRFNPEVLKAFILTMGIHPIGSIVQLNNGVIARVTEPRANAPMRPKIQMLIDENDKTPPDNESIFIDLLVHKNLYITKAMDLKELSVSDA